MKRKKPEREGEKEEKLNVFYEKSCREGERYRAGTTYLSLLTGR